MGFFNDSKLNHLCNFLSKCLLGGLRDSVGPLIDYFTRLGAYFMFNEMRSAWLD